MLENHMFTDNKYRDRPIPNIAQANLRQISDKYKTYLYQSQLKYISVMLFSLVLVSSPKPKLWSKAEN